MKKPNKIVIIGGGPAGLTLGLKLAQDGVPVEILEAEERVGGLCMTIPFQGCYFDLGGHRFITKDDEVKLFIETLMGDKLLTRPRKSIILLKNKALNYPVKAQDVLTKLGLRFSINAFVDYSLTSILQKIYPRSDSSFKQWVVNRFGSTLYDLYFGPYSEKLWGIAPCRISHRWADQRISLLNLWDVLARMLWRKEATPVTYANRFYYPEKGIGQICETMAREIEELGGTIRLSSPVCKVALRDDIITGITYISPDGSRRETSGDLIVNTSPLPQFIRMTGSLDNEDIESLTYNAHYRGIRFMNVCLDMPSVTDNTWIYIPEKEIIFFRIQELRNWSPTIVPEGKTALILEIACNENDEIWEMSDEELWKICYRDLVKLGLLKEDNATGYFSSYAPFAYPVYYLDYSENIKKIYSYISKIKNLRSIGRQGLFRYNNMDHSIKMGLLTAEHILQGHSFSRVMNIATETKIFDWQDPGKQD